MLPSGGGGGGRAAPRHNGVPGGPLHRRAGLPGHAQARVAGAAALLPADAGVLTSPHDGQRAYSSKISEHYRL